MAKRSSRKTEDDGPMARLQGLVLVALGLWIYAPILRGDWLWDDDKYITHNALIQDPAGFFKVLVMPDGLGNYDPLTSAVRWVQWQCWGDATLGCHLTNLGLHLATAFLLWRLFHRLRLPFAWFGALLFAVHPIMVESVAWIAELKNTLSLPTLLLAMLAFLDFDERGNRADYLRALAWFIVTMLAKTSGMMLPVVFLGYIWCKRGKVTWDEIKAGAPFFLVALIAGIVSILPHDDPFPHAEIVATGGLASRLASLGWAALFLLSKSLFPVDLLPAYPGNAVGVSSARDIFPWLVLVLGFGLLWSRRKTWGLPVLAGLGFFLVNLVPVFGFIAMNYATMVWSMDHLVYLPIIGLIGLFVVGVDALMKRLSPEARPFGTAALALLVTLLTFSSHRYAKAFSGEETLWRYAVKHSTDFYLAEENLGKALLVRDRPAEAKTYFDEVLRLKPQRATSHYDVGKVLVQLGRVGEGIAEYRRALDLDPTDSEVENNLGVALVQSGNLPEAVAHFTQAIHLKPDYALAYDNLGGALALLGRNREALDNFAQALKLMPDSVDAHDNLARVLLKLGRNDEARRHYEQALQLDPDDPKARDGLAKLQQLSK